MTRPDASDPRIEEVRGRVLVLRGDDIDTDRIIPARFLKVVTFEGLEAAVFADDRQEAARAGGVHPFDDPARAGARILLVNANFGCGSSREHAPQALLRRGLRAIVGVSFAEIFFGNAVAIGLPCLTVSPEDNATLMASADAHPQADCAVDLGALAVRLEGLQVEARMPETGRAALRSGAWDLTALLLAEYGQVERVASALPYLHDFPAR
jgi:3-isopropylmalate/(R)-2-methylmalate dehydratase small subunit